MTFWQSPDFKALQQAWYQRLADEGFQDAEVVVGENLVLKEHAAYAYRTIKTSKSRVIRLLAGTHEGELLRITRTEVNTTVRAAKEEYYRLLSAKAHDAQFRNDIDRLVLIRYAEGKKATEICDELRERGTPRFRHAIRFIVRRYETLWGIKKYTPQQLGKKAG